jgi:hypothetical protein
MRLSTWNRRSDRGLIILLCSSSRGGADLCQTAYGVTESSAYFRIIWPALAPLEKSLPQWRRVQTRFVNAIGKEHWKVLQELARLSAIARTLETGRPPAATVAPCTPSPRAAERGGQRD